jgi:hypothetical protein
MDIKDIRGEDVDWRMLVKNMI